MGDLYAIGDIHGRLDLLEAALAEIELRSQSATVVFLGDYVDRGPESRGVVELLMGGPRRPGDTFVCLKGNHEAMMVHCLAEEAMLGWWIGNGGGATLASYGGEVPPDHLAWIDGLPLMHREADRVFVHAGLMPGYGLDEQDEEAVLWIRDRFLRCTPKDHDFGVHVVHGHTPAWDGKPDPAKPELLPHRTNLDTAAFHTGVLTVAVFGESGPPTSAFAVMR
ncbi:metallophosphoesterase family protein [Phenylobacterium sp.]|uniref:metallophosphoesterase family protein n=1 Tax=Phenylobacterium sp. TaxID=1871053 RepID=UPI00262BDA0D|nr:metallophosphoesterase family protein [Phenylobacterium sp.]